MSNVLVIVTPVFNGEEFWVVVGSLKKYGHKPYIVSTSEYISDEDTYERIKVHELLSDMHDYDDEKFGGLVIITGPPKETREFWFNSHIQRLVKQADEQRHAVGAICVGVATIRHIAKGREVSHWPITRVRELLVSAGAIPSGLTMTRDGNLVTAEFQPAAKMWMKEFINVVEGKPKEFNLMKSNWERSHKPRKAIPILEELREKLDEGRKQK